MGFLGDVKMSEEKNLIGNQYGLLTVVDTAEPDAKGNRRWLCRCECGNTVVVLEGKLVRLHTRSCGCLKSPDLTGRVFGKLTVLGRSEKRNPRGARTTPMWECRCECGNITYKATDTLTNPDESMCKDCQGIYAAEIARRSAGFVGGTQISRITNMKPTSANSTGVRGVQFDKRSGRYRARLKFQGKLLNFGSYRTLEEAAAARKAAEEEYFGAFLEAIGQGK